MITQEEFLAWFKHSLATDWSELPPPVARFQASASLYAKVLLQVPVFAAAFTDNASVRKHLCTACVLLNVLYRTQVSLTDWLRLYSPRLGAWICKPE